MNSSSFFSLPVVIKINLGELVGWGQKLCVQSLVEKSEESGRD
jgi:hypothetical protein